MTVLSFPNLVVIETATAGTLPPLADGAPAVFRALSGQMFLRNANSGLYHELIASRVLGVVVLGCVAVGLAFSALPPASSLDASAAPQDGQNMVWKPAAGKLFVRCSVAPVGYFDLTCRNVGDVPVVGLEETLLTFGSLPASPVPNTTPAADGQDVIYRPATGRLFARNRSAGGLYHELAVYDVLGVPSVGCLTVGVPFSSIL